MACGLLLIPLAHHGLSEIQEFTMKLASVTSMTSEDVNSHKSDFLDDVVEIGILLPANRAAELIRIARSRHESVGHMIRTMIDRELALTRCSG